MVIFLFSFWGLIKTLLFTIVFLFLILIVFGSIYEERYKTKELVKTKRKWNDYIDEVESKTPLKTFDIVSFEKLIKKNESKLDLENQIHNSIKLLNVLKSFEKKCFNEFQSFEKRFEYNIKENKEKNIEKISFSSEYNWERINQLVSELNEFGSICNQFIETLISNNKVEFYKLYEVLDSCGVFYNNFERSLLYSMNSLLNEMKNVSSELNLINEELLEVNYKLSKNFREFESLKFSLNELKERTSEQTKEIVKTKKEIKKTHN